MTYDVALRAPYQTRHIRARKCSTSAYPIEVPPGPKRSIPVVSCHGFRAAART